MTIRKPLSKRTRFEVLKRDKFTCQYCGKRPPEVVLQVDHIDPVSSGGENVIINLITSCFECNNGKSNKKLDDNSVIEKQHNQLAILQEKREQIELMFEWKKSLDSLDNGILEMLVDYVDNKIKPFILNDNEKKSIAEWLKKYSNEKLLDGIDEAAKTYFKYENGFLIKESVEHFFKKIAGVIIVKDLPPIKQKIAYIKGIAKNRFTDWDEKDGSIILNYYLAALNDCGLGEEKVLNKLEYEVITLTKDVENWSYWKIEMRKWIFDLNYLKFPDNFNSDEDLYAKTDKLISYLEALTDCVHSSIEIEIDGLIKIGSMYPSFEKIVFQRKMALTLIDYLRQLENDFNSNQRMESQEDENKISEFINKSGLLKYFEVPKNSSNFELLLFLREKCFDGIKKILNEFYRPIESYTPNDMRILFKIHLDYFEEILLGLQI